MKFLANELEAALAEPTEQAPEALTQHVRKFVESRLYYAKNQEQLVDDLLVMVLSAPLAQPAAPQQEGKS